MLVTPAGPKALLNWFWYGQRHPYRFLVLLAAGGVGQAAFFREIFEQKENLDVVSGPDIAVFLFGDERDHGIIGLSGSKPYELLVIPGRQVGLKGRADSSSLRMLRVSDLPSDSRELVVRKSMTSTSELCERLRLDEKYIPSIVVLSKMLAEDTLVVRTQDVASVADFMEFLRALRTIVARLPPRTLEDALAGAAKAGREFPIEEYRSARQTHEKAKADLRHEMAALVEGLAKHGMSKPEIDRLQTEVDHLLGRDSKLANFFGCLRLSWLLSSTKLDDASIKAIRASVQSDQGLKDAIRRIRPLLRATEQVGNRYRKLDRALGAIAHVHDQYSRYISEQENIFEEIDQLASKYEARFFWFHKVKKVGQFITAAAGLAKQAKDTHDIISLLTRVDQKSS